MTWSYLAIWKANIFQKKKFSNYVLKDKPVNVKGYFSTTPQEVTYIYTKKTVSNVTVHYQDEAGKTIAYDKILSGKLDDKFTAEPKTLLTTS